MLALPWVVALETILVVILAVWVWSLARRVETARAPSAVTPPPPTPDVNFVTAFRLNPCAMTIARLSNGQFLDVNESFERQTGFSRDDVIGRSIAESGMWIDPEDLAAVSAEVRVGGKLGSREVRYRTKRGAPATAVYSADVIMFRGEPCVLAAGLDVTDRKHAELQAAALREELAHLGRVTMLDALTGSLAHEINQPLAAMMANTEAALRMVSIHPPPLRELRDTLGELLSDNRRAGDVLQRMRTLLKKGSTRYEPLEVNTTVTEVVKLVQGNAVGRRIILDVELASDIAPVMGDRIQVQQVVLNLLMNAFDAVQERDIDERHVRVRTAPREQAAVVEVIDRGSGLSDDALALIFEPFYTTKKDGMGLGLSISRAIVGAHGGSLDAMRNPEAGMTFSASFPFWQSLESAGPITVAAHRLQES
jgi:PAS domain S-box-containing protein